MRSDIILVRDKGQAIPSSMLEAATSKNTSAQGVAFAHPEHGLCADSEASSLNPADIDGHQKEWKDFTTIYHLCESVGEVKAEDLQPFVLVVDGEGEKAVTHCVGFLAGGFEGIENDGQFSDAHVFVEQYLKPTLDGMWRGDIEKFAASLKNKPFQLTMNAMCGKDGTVVLLCSNGAVEIFSKSPTAEHTAWGFTSDTLGIKEGSFPAKEEGKGVIAAIKKKVGGITKSSATAPAAPADQPKPVEPAKVVPPIAPGAPATKPAIAPSPTVGEVLNKSSAIHKGPTVTDLQPKTNAAMIEDLVFCVPPKDISINKTHDWYYKNNSGVVPDNYREHPPIRMSREKAMRKSSVKILPADDGRIKAFSDLAGKVKTTTQADQVQPTREAENLPAPKTITQPVVKVDELEKVNSILQNSKRIMDPKEWQSLENKNPTFWQAHGIDRHRAQHLPLEAREAICRVSPLDGARGWMNADWLCFQLTQELAALRAKETKAVEAVAAEQPAVVARKSIGGIKKVA